MKSINFFLLRSISALVIGIVLVAWPESAIQYLVVTIGVLFMIPGLISMITYFARNRQIYPDSIFPLAGAGSFLFGLWLVMTPGFFVNILMYILGFCLLLGGLQQLVSLSGLRKWVKVPAGYYIIPVFVLVAGIIIVLNPFEVLNTTLKVLGIVSIIYALNDMLNWFKFKQKVNKIKSRVPQIEDAEIIEE